MAPFGLTENHSRREFRVRIRETGSLFPQAASNCTSLKAVSGQRSEKFLTTEFAEKSRKERKEKQLRDFATSRPVLCALCRLGALLSKSRRRATV